MGFVVDLSVMWEPYKAAAAALRNTMDMAVVREVHARQVDPHPALYTPSPKPQSLKREAHARQVEQVQECQQALEGWLTAYMYVCIYTHRLYVCIHRWSRCRSASRRWRGG